MFAKNRRGILWLVLAVALAVGIGVAIPLLPPRLPDPAVANRDQLLRWLVARDLAKESPKTRLVLIQRLEKEFHSGVDWEALKRNTTEAQRKQLWSNIPLLLGPWLNDRASAYSQLPQSERLQFIDEVIDSLTAWSGAEKLQPCKEPCAAQKNDSDGMLSAVLSQVEECKRTAEPKQRDHISHFLADLQLRFLLR